MYNKKCCVFWHINAPGNGSIRLLKFNNIAGTTIVIFTALIPVIIVTVLMISIAVVVGVVMMLMVGAVVMFIFSIVRV